MKRALDAWMFVVIWACAGMAAMALGALVAAGMIIGWGT